MRSLHTAISLIILAIYLVIKSCIVPVFADSTSTHMWQSSLPIGTRGIAWSPNHAYLAITSLDGKLVVYNVFGDQIQELQASDGALYTVAWSPDGGLLATGGDEALIRIWRAESGELVHELSVLMDGVTSLAWQPIGDVLLAAGNDRFQAWSTSSWEPISEPLSVTLQDLRWSPDGGRFAFAALTRIGTATVNESRNVDVSSFPEIAPIPYSVSWNATGDRLLSAGGQDGSVRLWDANSGEQLAVLLQTDQIVTDAVFVDGADSQIVAITDEGTAYLVDVLTTQVLEEHTFDASLWRAAWNPQYNLLAISGKSNEIAGESGFLNISLPTFEEPPTPTPVPTETPIPTLTFTPTPLPTPTSTPAAFQKLRLTSMCSANPAVSRTWRVRNANPYPVSFTWDIYNSPTRQRGSGVVPAAVGSVQGEVLFSTVTEAGANTLRVFVNGAQQDVKASGGATCQ